MSFFTDLNKYIETLSSDWVLVESFYDGNKIYLENEKAGSKISIEYYQDLIVRNGKVKPYLKGSVGVLENFDNHDDVDKIAFDVNEIIRKNT